MDIFVHLGWMMAMLGTPWPAAVDGCDVELPWVWVCTAPSTHRFDFTGTVRKVSQNFLFRTYMKYVLQGTNKTVQQMSCIAKISYV